MVPFPTYCSFLVLISWWSWRWWVEVTAYPIVEIECSKSTLQMTPHHLVVINRWKWWNGVLAKHGNMYTCPLNANQILQIHIQNQIWEVGFFSLIRYIVQASWWKWYGDWKWLGGGRAENGFIYGIPVHSYQVLSISPNSNNKSYIIPTPILYIHLLSKIPYIDYAEVTIFTIWTQECHSWLN